MGYVPHRAEVTVEPASKYMNKYLNRGKSMCLAGERLVKIPEVTLEQNLEG